MFCVSRNASFPEPEDSVGVEVLTELDLHNIWERPFWTAPKQFDAPELSDHEPDDDDRLAAFRRLAGLQRLDWETMRENVTSMLREASRIPLPELLEAHPPTAGAVEVLGYVQIAHDDGHHIDNRVTETIRLGPPEADGPGPDPDDAELFDVPHVVFLSRELRSLDRGLALGESR